MVKIDGFRLAEFISLTLFGFVGYVYTIWQWTEKTDITIIFAVIFIIVVAIIPVLYKAVRDWIKEQKSKGE